MPKATRKQISPNFDMSFLPTDQQIKDIQEAKKHHNGISIESVNDKKILEKQLCEFVVGVRRDDGEEYLSLKNCMAAIDRHLKSHSVIKDQITLNGNACKQNYPDLYKTLNGKLRDLKKQVTTETDNTCDLMSNDQDAISSDTSVDDSSISSDAFDSNKSIDSRHAFNDISNITLTFKRSQL
ncbi:972_t:CDS:2 [Entrophospora sp. SA101]|nr:972_t:CDS:2 [Entrophospora sp. SA101]